MSLLYLKRHSYYRQETIFGSPCLFHTKLRIIQETAMRFCPLFSYITRIQHRNLKRKPNLFHPQKTPKLSSQQSALKSNKGGKLFSIFFLHKSQHKPFPKYDFDFFSPFFFWIMMFLAITPRFFSLCVFVD